MSASSLAVTFTVLSSGSPDQWSWDFGDSGTSSLQSPSDTYTAPGKYTVTLTATNGQGSDAEVKVDYIKVGVPVANFSADQTSGTAPLDVIFTDSSSGTPTSWLWDFGDGNTSTAQNPPTHTYSNPGQYTVTLTATNAQGSDPEVKVNYITVTSSGGGTTVTVVAAGDIACDPASSSFNGGLGTSSACRQKYTADLIGAINPVAVLTLGDNQYESSTLSNFQASFELSWGQYFDKIFPATGNHEYQVSGAPGYFSYFTNHPPNAARPTGGQGKGYYSFDVGEWHMIVLNSNCSGAGGCGAGSPQETWLKADLAAHTNACTLAYWHHPRFYGTSIRSSVQALWQDLYDYNADLVLNGHVHHYERFARVNVAGAADAVRGIREIISGTGGVNIGGGSPSGILQVVGGTFGVLKLDLAPTSFTWNFVPEAGKTWTDSGTDQCH